MNRWAIEVASKPGLLDAEGNQIERDIADLGLTIRVRVRVARMYWIEGDLSDEDVAVVTEKLLADPISETYTLCGDLLRDETHAEGWIATIRLKPGVTDAVGESVCKGARDLGIARPLSAATGRQVYLFGQVDRDDAERICERLLVNDVIQTYSLRALNS